MKEKVLKILLFISFIPYIFLIGYSIYESIDGFVFLSGTPTYGLEGFYDGFVIMAFVLVTIYPVIPIVLIYQIFYFLRYKIKKYKEEEKDIKILFKRIGIVIFSIIALFFIYILMLNVAYNMENVKIKRFIEKSEEKILYDTKHTKNYDDGLFDMSEYRNGHIFVDYDTNEIGVLSYFVVEDFEKVKLIETNKDSEEYKNIINNYYMQIDVSLKKPGRRLVGFYNDEIGPAKTIAFLLFYEDGRIFYIDNIYDDEKNLGMYTWFNDSKYFVGNDVKFIENDYN